MARPKAWGAHGTFNDHSRHYKVHQSGKPFFLENWQADAYVRPFFDRRRGIRGAADAERDIRGTALKYSTPKTGNRTSLATILQSFSSAILLRSLRPEPRHQARPPHRSCERSKTNWDFWEASASRGAASGHSGHVRNRGNSRSFRHMHLFGSHTFSMINAESKRTWVKFHFRSQQGIENLTDEAAAAVVANDRESNGRDLLEAIDRGDFPRWTAVHLR